MSNMNHFALLVVAALALFVAGRWLERSAGRPGLNLGIGGGLMLVVGLVALTNRSWLMSGLFFVQAVIFLFEAWERHKGTRIGGAGA